MLFRPALIQNNALALGAPNLALHSILVKARVQYFSTRAQIQGVKIILAAWRPLRTLIQREPARPNLRVLELAGLLADRFQYRSEIAVVINKRFAVIGKWQGD